MRKANTSARIRYFDLLFATITLAILVASVFTAMRQTWPWNHEDSFGLGLFLATTLTFIRFRRKAYSQRTPWILFCVLALTVAAMVVLFRRWSTGWVSISSAILLLGLFMRSKTIPEPTFRNVAVPALLVAGGLVISLGLTEGTLRLVPGLLPEGARLRVYRQGGGGEPWAVPHPYIGHLHIADANSRAHTARPGVTSATIDMWGFRNSWPWPEKVEIVAVGDSMTYSQTVSDDQAWTTILDQNLRHTRVLNLGLIGAAPQQYLRVYETFGVDRNPKVLLVGLFLGNDLWGAKDFDRWWTSGAAVSYVDSWRPEAAPGLKGLVLRAMKKTYLLALLRDLNDSYQAGRFLAGKTISLADGGRVQLVPGLLARVARDAHPQRTAFRLVLEALVRTHELASQHGAYCLVLFFPSKEEVYLPIAGEEAPDLAMPFIPELKERGIAYLDLGPSFRRRAAAGQTLFWEVDGHPNERGYALIAETVLFHLKANSRRYGLKD